MKDEFIHEQFKRVWDDLHGLRQYIRLQFQHYDSCFMKQANKAFEEEKKAEAPPSELKVKDIVRMIWTDYMNSEAKDDEYYVNLIRNIACKKVDEINVEFKKEGMYKFYYVLDTIKQALRGM